MSIDTNDTSCNLEELEVELEKLLSKLHTEDNNLSVWNEFDVVKNIEVPTHWKVLKWSKVEIVWIKKWTWTNTTTIRYKISWENEAHKMSEWIFIVTFCENIVAEWKKTEGKIRKLRKEIKEKRDAMQESWAACLTKEVKDEVKWILGILKRALKKLK